MYKVTIRIQGKDKKVNDTKVFEIAEEGTSAYHDQMNELSDYLYELDIPFDVDMDGDMMIDDILMSITEGEAFEKEIKTKKATYRIVGEI